MPPFHPKINNVEGNEHGEYIPAEKWGAVIAATHFPKECANPCNLPRKLLEAAAHHING